MLDRCCECDCREWYPYVINPFRTAVSFRGQTCMFGIRLVCPQKGTTVLKRISLGAERGGIYSYLSGVALDPVLIFSWHRLAGEAADQMCVCSMSLRCAMRETCLFCIRVCASHLFACGVYSSGFIPQVIACCYGTALNEAESPVIPGFRC